MERLYSVADIMERYHLRSRQTACKRMKQMVTRLDTKPYLVPESAVLEWERSKEVHPPGNSPGGNAETAPDGVEGGQT